MEQRRGQIRRAVAAGGLVTAEMTAHATRLFSTIGATLTLTRRS